MAASVLVFRGIMRSSRNTRPGISITPSPTKTTFQRQLDTSKPSNQKRRITSRKAIKKSQSENGLSSQFRSLSLTPNPHPPSNRSRSISPKKSRIRGLATVSAKNIVDIANLIKEQKCQNIIIMAGAGISTPSGIPDFRTPGTGLYDNLQQYNIPEPTAIFDIEYFWYDPRPFFCLAKELYPGNFQPNYVHYFIKLLHDKGLLFRMYTQNIDGLEKLVGIPSDKLIEAHGTFSTASCVRCHRNYDGDSIKAIILKGEIPKCESDKCTGIIKPDIVFFGEDLPQKFYSFEDDFPKCDLLVVMGTSLEVEPFAGIVNKAGRSTPRLLINRETVGPFASPWKSRRNDVVLKGDVVSGVKRLVKLLEWNDEMYEMITEGNENWRNKTELEKNERENGLDSSQEDMQHSPIQNGKPQTRGYHTMVQNSTHNLLDNPIPRKRNLRSVTLRDRNFIQQRKTLEKSSILPGKCTSIPGNHGPIPGHTDHSFHSNHAPRNSLTKQSLFACNSVARRTIPLLPFRYTHKSDIPTQGNFRSINPKKDLASAGFGRHGIKDMRNVKFYLSSSDSSDSSSSDDSDSEG